ncbi:hypothetical protein FBU30_009918 [Linnemannia zychae]|nr:hypothetical protein FBU30_009918 [Linnemannia zychae]
MSRPHSTDSANISTMATVLAIPEILSSILASLDTKYLPNCRLVSRAFLQACIPYFFINIVDTSSRQESRLSEKDLTIIQEAGHLIRSLTLSPEDSAIFDSISTSLHLQRLHLKTNCPNRSTEPLHRIYRPLFKEGSTICTQLSELAINVAKENFGGTEFKWNALCNPRSLLDPKEGLDSPLGLILSRISSLKIINRSHRYLFKPLRWPILVDILSHVCPKLTELVLENATLNDAASPFMATPTLPVQDVFPNITTLVLHPMWITIPQLIQFNNHFPNLENVYVRILNDNTHDASSRIDRSAALSFKSATLMPINSSNLAMLLPLLPNMTRLKISTRDDFDVASMVAAFRALGNRNQFKELSIPVEWSVADFKSFLQLDCLRSLEYFEIGNSGKEFIEAIGDVAIEASESSTLASSVSTISVLPKIQFPVFTNTIRELRLVAISDIEYKSTILTSSQVLILKRLLKKMTCLKGLRMEELILPDLTLFDGINHDTDGKEDGDNYIGNNIPRLRYFYGSITVKTEPINPEMITSHILDRLAPDLEELKINIVVPRAVMKEPWVDKLREREDLVSNQKGFSLPSVNLSIVMKVS